VGLHPVRQAGHEGERHAAFDERLHGGAEKGSRVESAVTAIFLVWNIGKSQCAHVMTRNLPTHKADHAGTPANSSEPFGIEYFSGIESGFVPLFAQANVARRIVAVHDREGHPHFCGIAAPGPGNAIEAPLCRRRAINRHVARDPIPLEHPLLADTIVAFGDAVALRTIKDSQHVRSIARQRSSQLAIAVDIAIPCGVCNARRNATPAADPTCDHLNITGAFPNVDKWTEKEVIVSAAEAEIDAAAACGRLSRK
jgi:hypothetical protein